MKKITRDNIYLHLLEKQFNILEKTVQDALFDKNWREWTISSTQEEEFKKYTIPLLKKTFKCNKTKAESTYEWFRFNHGLPIR